MPRLSAAASTAIRSGFSHWLRQALEESNTTIGALAYATRPHVAEDGAEISYSNLKKFVAGDSAPSLPTVLRLVALLSRTGRMKRSILTAFMASYPDAVARVAIGLDVIGLDAYWESFRTQPQLQRQMARRRFNARIGLRGLRALPQPGQTPPWKKTRPARRLVNWIDEITKHHDLFAICVAYAFFCPRNGDTASIAMRNVYSQFDEAREAWYWEALRRYPDFNRHSYHLAGPDLEKAEQLLANYEMPIEDRKALAAPHFARWTFDHAEDFVDSVPLLEWVHQDTLRDSLGLP